MCRWLGIKQGVAEALPQPRERFRCLKAVYCLLQCTNLPLSSWLGTRKHQPDATRCIKPSNLSVFGTELLWTAFALRQTFLTLSCLGHTDEPFAQTCTVTFSDIHVISKCICGQDGGCAPLWSLLQLCWGCLFWCNNISPHIHLALASAPECHPAVESDCYDIIGLWQKIDRLNGVNVNGYWYHLRLVLL